MSARMRAWLGRALPTILALTAVAVLVLNGSASIARAGETLREVKARGTVRCGVSEGVAGFSVQDSSGRWAGLDVDFCRAVAAAALGDGGRVAFVPLRASARFPALVSNRIDLLARHTTWTLEREAGVKVAFGAILFYDGQGFVVRTSSGITGVSQLSGATICVEKGTTSERNLTEFFAARGMPVKPLVIDTTAGIAEAFFADRCR